MLMSSNRNTGKLINWKKLGIAIIILACLVIGGFGQVATAAEKGPIKIGFTACLTGNFAKFGKDMLNGFTMYLDEINWEVAGRKIKLIVEDEVNTSVAVTKVRKMIVHDKVDMVTGIFLTPATYSLAPLCTKEKIPMFINLSAGDDVTQRRRSPYVTRTHFTGCQLGHVAGDYAYRKMGWRTAVTIGMDVGWGHEGCGAFHRVFEELGGRVIQKVWTPFKTIDFGPFVASLDRKADGLVDWITGAQTIRFFKALRESGKKWDVIATGPATDETYLPSMGKYAEGVYSVLQHSIALQNPENIAFVKRARKWLKGGEPTSFMAMLYEGAKMICDGIRAVDGNVEDKLSFINAVRAIEYSKSIRGPLRIDKYGQPINNEYIRRVDKVGDQYQNTVVYTYPMVSQFWKYDPEEYMKKPLYSREYPPCKWCK